MNEYLFSSICVFGVRGGGEGVADEITFITIRPELKSKSYETIFTYVFDRNRLN